MIDLNKISKILNLPIDEIYNVYIYGSFIYETNNVDSDVDHIIVCNQTELKKDYHTLDSNIQITSYNIDGFHLEIENHNISILECLFLEDKYKIENIKFYYTIDLSKLRESISKIISNSYVKCKKKYIDNEILIGQKSLFHCFRICYYGTQIAKYEKIIDFIGINFSDNYKNFKELLEEIKKEKSWEVLNNKYRPTLNHNLTEFRIVAPKI